MYISQLWRAFPVYTVVRGQFSTFIICEVGIFAVSLLSLSCVVNIYFVAGRNNTVIKLRTLPGISLVIQQLLGK